MNHRDSAVPAGDEAALNQHLVDKGLTAPRVTPEMIDAEIEFETYFTAAQGHLGAGNGDFGPPVLGLLTFCVLGLKNGFTVTGESACASPENFDEAVGRAIAKRNARDKIWALLGFRLRDQLSKEG